MTLPRDYRLQTAPDVCATETTNPQQVLHLSDLVVEGSGGKLRVRTVDRRLQFDILEVFDFYLSLVGANYFTLMSLAAHTPRVTIDDVVIARESWRFNAKDMEFVAPLNNEAVFSTIRNWAQTYDLPRFLFFRSIRERKPCFLDLESPLAVELFAHDVQRALEESTTASFIITLSEMLPQTDHAWLPDSSGERYTCEIRMVAVDMAECRPATVKQ